MPSPWLALAATLLAALGAGHSYLGERHFLPRLFARGPTAPHFAADGFSRRTLRFVWHLASVGWWGAAALCGVLGRGDAAGGLRVVAATVLASGVVTAAGSRGRHPAWALCVVIAAAAWRGAS
ncbi:hypothetical protein [Roseisolibacter sp. H3M3-2]|uniref:hypothetical protein n=1 Tax=Roseisolibacter sp. H3M3-2 TaxID=3031323 RepID=UPI0023DC4CB4|nr:hypothetical protein [Roseisolibacter sp. H3M3-2]MDF1506257.1 hypothetical protein [Roseisolibacter sp. H3M3-2]